MAAFQHKPIERHEAIAPFSRDHYVGLVHAHRMKKAASSDDVARRKAVAAFIDAWDNEIAEHFADEERLLIAWMDDADRTRLLREHERIRSLAGQVRDARRQSDPEPTLVGELGDTLEKHIRWEERELFGRLRRQMTDDQLERLASHTAPIEASRPRNICRSSERTE